MNDAKESSAVTRPGGLWAAVAGVPLRRIVVFLLQFQLVLLLSFFTPVVIRRWTTARFIVHEEALEFTFQTCGGNELAGVCSFPEALLELGPESDAQLELHAGYSHSFEFEFTLHGTENARRFGVFIIRLELRDGDGTSLAVYSKAAQVPKLAKKEGGGWLALFWWPFNLACFATRVTRNVIFWPLYCIGYFNPSPIDPAALDAGSISQPATVSFNSRSSLFTESASTPTRQIAVRVENRHLEIASATLRVRAHVGWWCWWHSYFPVSSYLSLAGVCFTAYFFVFAAYWTRIAVVHYYRHGKAQPIDGAADTDPAKASSGEELSDVCSKVVHDEEELTDKLSSSIDGWDDSSWEDASMDKPTEFAPNQPGELPDCPELTGIHGWSVDSDKD